jgi:hypothetical protein
LLSSERIIVDGNDPQAVGNYIIVYHQTTTSRVGHAASLCWKNRLIYNFSNNSVPFFPNNAFHGLPDTLVLIGHNNNNPSDDIIIFQYGDLVFEGQSRNLIGFGGNNVATYVNNLLTIFSNGKRIYEQYHNFAESISGSQNSLVASPSARFDERMFLRVDNMVFIVDDQWGLLKFDIDTFLAVP